MAFTRVIAQGANRPITAVKIGAAANVSSVIPSASTYFGSYKLEQNSETAYFNAPSDAKFTTDDYVILGVDGYNSFMKGAEYTATYTAVE
jgi:hypothetical protein